MKKKIKKLIAATVIGASLVGGTAAYKPVKQMVETAKTEKAFKQQLTGFEKEFHHQFMEYIVKHDAEAQKPFYKIDTELTIMRAEADVLDAAELFRQASLRNRIVKLPTARYDALLNVARKYAELKNIELHEAIAKLTEASTLEGQRHIPKEIWDKYHNRPTKKLSQLGSIEKEFYREMYNTMVKIEAARNHKTANLYHLHDVYTRLHRMDKIFLEIGKKRPQRDYQTLTNLAKKYAHQRGETLQSAINNLYVLMSSTSQPLNLKKKYEMHCSTPSAKADKFDKRKEMYRDQSKKPYRH